MSAWCAVHGKRRTDCGCPADLFDIPGRDARTRRKDPDTSKRAARRASTGRIDALILSALGDSDPEPLAYWQISEIIGVREVCMSSRLVILRERGLIARVRRERNPNSGKLCWAEGLTEAGRAFRRAQAAN